jgi:hypothetical protein
MNKLIVSRFPSLWKTKPSKNESLLDILVEIKSDKYKNLIDQINGDTKSPIKNKLPLFTPTGTFNQRSIKGMEEYNGVICLDIDKVENPQELKTQCDSIPWVSAAFITPSYKGLKVIVQTDATTETYKDIEIKVSSEFEKITGFARDNRCKDIARIQFVSYDPNAYVNEKSIMFQS